jgi:hypothetical protein
LGSRRETVQPNCSPFGCTRIWKGKIAAFLMRIVDALERDCSLDSIDAHLPKLDVAGSIPVSRSLKSVVYGEYSAFQSWFCRVKTK